MSNCKFPWHDWLDGKIRVLLRGVDFHYSAASLRFAAQAACDRRGLELYFRVRGRRVWLCALSLYDRPPTMHAMTLRRDKMRCEFDRLRHVRADEAGALDAKNP